MQRSPSPCPLVPPPRVRHVRKHKCKGCKGSLLCSLFAVSLSTRQGALVGTAGACPRALPDTTHLHVRVRVHTVSGTGMQKPTEPCAPAAHPIPSHPTRRHEWQDRNPFHANHHPCALSRLCCVLPWCSDAAAFQFRPHASNPCVGPALLRHPQAGLVRPCPAGPPPRPVPHAAATLDRLHAPCPTPLPRCAASTRLTLLRAPATPPAPQRAT